MSQFYQGVTAGALPPAVPTSFVTDVNSPSIPIANIENVIGGATTANNVNGVRTDGSSGSNTLTVQLTNRIPATVTTTDATPTVLLTFPYSTNTGPGTYLFDFKVVVYNITDALSSGYDNQICVRYDGANGVLVTPTDTFIAEEGAMITSGITFTATNPTNLLVTVTGLIGKTIHWLCSATYIYVS